MRKRNSKYKNSTFICPHCNKMLDNRGRRYHFDLCSDNPNSDQFFKKRLWKGYHKYKRKLIREYKINNINPKLQSKYQQWLRLHNQDDTFDYKKDARDPGRSKVFIKSISHFGDVYYGKTKAKENNGPYSGKYPTYNKDHTCKLDNYGLISVKSFEEAIDNDMNLKPFDIKRKSLKSLQSKEEWFFEITNDYHKGGKDNGRLIDYVKERYKNNYSLDRYLKYLEEYGIGEE